MTAENNARWVFIKVVGFNDVERHALNTVFRLSGQREIVYSLWLDGAPERPKLALVDGESEEARMELAASPESGLKLIWIGNDAPENAWRSFQRPLSWPDVVNAMDELFTPPMDFELDFDSSEMDTLPPPAEEPGKRALIACADREERLYLRAKLALVELTHADEAETGAQALELARTHQYSVAVLDFALPDVNGWALLKELRQAQPAIPHLILTKEKASATERVRAWWAGAAGCFDKPPHPGKLHDLLQRV